MGVKKRAMRVKHSLIMNADTKTRGEGVMTNLLDSLFFRVHRFYHLHYRGYECPH